MFKLRPETGVFRASSRIAPGRIYNSLIMMAPLDTAHVRQPAYATSRIDLRLVCPTPRRAMTSPIKPPMQRLGPGAGLPDLLARHGCSIDEVLHGLPVQAGDLPPRCLHAASPRGRDLRAGGRRDEVRRHRFSARQGAQLSRAGRGWPADELLQDTGRGARRLRHIPDQQFHRRDPPTSTGSETTMHSVSASMVPTSAVQPISTTSLWLSAATSSAT